MTNWTDPKPWNSTDIPKNRCPFCGYLSEAASTPGDKSPEPGSIAVCMSCASVLVFDNDLLLRAMTQAEFADLHPDNRKEILLIQRGIRMLDRRKLKGNMRGIP
jgi:hypothetical protein